MDPEFQNQLAPQQEPLQNSPMNLALLPYAPGPVQNHQKLDALGVAHLHQHSSELKLSVLRSVLHTKPMSHQHFDTCHQLAAWLSQLGSLAHFVRLGNKLIADAMIHEHTGSERLPSTTDLPTSCRSESKPLILHRACVLQFFICPRSQARRTAATRCCETTKLRNI